MPTPLRPPTQRKAITLYTAATPNGWKVSCALEEFGVPYEVRAIDFKTKEQRSEWYLKICPNGRIPAIVDHANEDFPVFESGAILIYLADRLGKLGGKTPNEKSQVLQWVMFQMAGIGPMQGQANHFLRHAPGKNEYAVERYMKETLRLYGVLDKHLEGRNFIVGNDITVADIANITWVLCAGYINLNLDNFPNLDRWSKTIASRPAIRRGLQVPSSASNPLDSTNTTSTNNE